MNKDGLSFSCDVKIDARAAIERFNAITSRAQKKLDARIVADSNYYCPLRQGALQKSAITSTVVGSGTIIWRAPYARRQYYGVTFDHGAGYNPNACAKWFEAAKARKAAQWLELVQNEFTNS